MSLKSIGNVSAILKEIAVSGSISKATFDSLNLSLQGLNEAQIAATVSLSGLSAEQVASSLKASGFTATQTAATMATLQFSEQATMAAMSAAGFEKAQIKDAVAATTFTAAETAATAATGGLSAAMSGLTAVMAANPFMIAVTAISLLIAIVPMAINLFNKFHKTTEELKQEYDDLASELDGLNSELKTTKDRIAELQKLSDEGRITLVEQEELDRLLETNAQLERQIRLKNEAAQEAADKSNKSLVKDYNNEYYNSNAGMYMLFDADAIRANNAEGFKALEEWHNGWSENWDKFSEEEQERLLNLYSEYQNLMLEGNNKLQYPEQLGFDDYVDQLIARYKELEGLGQNATDSQIAEMASIRSELLSLSQTLQNDYIDNFVGDGEDVKNWNNIADAIDACINPAEHFTSLLEKLPNDLKDVLNSEGSEGGLTAERINELAGQYQELAKWMEDSGYTADELASHYNALKVETDSNTESTGRYSAQLSDLTETLSDLQSAYDVLATAQEEMAGGGGLSPDTIADLAEAEANYLDYLYEENGVIKLNTEAWKENANAKMLGDIDEIQKEISSLEERNEVLAQSLEMYRTNKGMSIGDTSSIAAWDKKIKDTTDEINANTEAIAANQAKLALYSSLYGSITGDTNAYASALNNFTNIANTIDSVSDSFQTLADLQAQVANGFTMSLDKALEFAKVYPEILNNAQVSSNGQIALNKEVVNSFLTSKKKELDTQIDTQIAELQADKTVLEAKMQAAQAQLELAKNVGEGEGQVAKEVAEYRIKASNEMVQALIDNGIDEAEAYKLAAQSMALNAEEFDRVARDVCTDVDGNFNAAAYNAAMGIYENMERAKTDIASVAKQAHESAKAIEGMANGVVKGSVTKFAGSLGGKLRDKIKTNITSGEFNGFDFDFDFKGASLEDFASQVELDISSYQKAISQIDGQIAALQALKNAPLKNFKSGSGGSGSSTKEIEEYTAAIDDYREAIERLNRVQIKKSDLETQLSNTNDLRTQIELQQELIGVYKEEQNALHDLNELRDQTIKDGAESLRQLGFDVEYDPDKNNFFVKNLEHLNELTADSKGKYGSLQEATNALRKDTESLINTLGELNKANQENSDSWVELAYRIQEANIAIYENTAKEHENAITKNENLLNHAIESNDRGEITRNTGEIVDHYRAMQEAVRQEAEYYRSLGYADTSDEITKLEDLWWDYYDEIKTVSADAWQQVVDNAHDALDQITGLYDTLKDAAKEFSESGYITVSTFQEIAKLGVENLAYLQDENGMLVINEENIQKVIAARTQQMAIETALNYVQQLRQALADNDVVALMNLTTATNAASSSTWDLVYAQLQLLGLDSEQYGNALNRINALRSLSDVAITSIGKVDGAAKKMIQEQSDALSDLLKYVEEMIKQEVKNQVKALEDQVDAYKEIVDLQKKSLDLEKEKDDYTKSVKDKQKEIADLRKQIYALDLDDSREAAAKKDELQEQLSEKINDLADYQSDHAYDAASDMLDDMADSYEKEKQKEIDILENTISSEEKLYQLAIDRINNHWDTLYQDLINWNYEYGSVTNDEITSAWNNASAAVQQYGSYLNAVLETQRQIAAYEASSNSYTIGGSSDGNSQGGSAIGKTGNYDTSGSQTLGQVKNIVHQMKANSAAHHSADTAGKARLNKANLDLGKQLTSLIGRTAVRGDDGVWYLDRVGGPKLYETYPYSTYHGGGIAGDDPTLKQKEIMAKLEKGEAIITEKQQDSLYRILDSQETMLAKFGKLAASANDAKLFESRMGEQIRQDAQQAQSMVENSSFNITVTAPVQVYPLQKLDQSEIKKLTKDISKHTITELNLTSITQTPYGNDMTFYIIRGGTIGASAANAVLNAQMVNGTLQVNSDRSFVFSLYLNKGTFNGMEFPSGSIAMTGTLSTSVSNSTSFLQFKTSSATLYLTQDVTEYQKMSIEWELFEYGFETLKKMSSHDYFFSISVVNFLALDDYIDFAKELSLGERAYLQIEKGVVTPIVTSIEVDFDDLTDFTIDFGNAYKLNDASFKFEDLLDQSVSSASSLDFNKYNYSNFVNSGAKTQVKDFMTSAIDTMKNMIMSGANNELTIDQTGLRCRKYDEASGGYSPKQLWLAHNALMFTNDNWNSATIGIGEFVDKNLGSIFGIIAPAIVGTILAGSSLVIESEKQDGGVAVFKVDAEGASLHNASFNLYGSSGGRIDLGAIYGIVAGSNKNNLFYYDSKGQPTGVRTVNNRSITKISDLASGDSPNANFWLDMYGSAYFKGKILATSGEIGGFTIASSYLYSGSGSTRVAINGGTDYYSAYAFWAGATNPANAPFWVKKNGDFHAMNGDFGGTLNAPNLKGVMTADASGGWIEGCGIRVGRNYGANMGYNFYVDPNGNVWMQGNLVLKNGSISWANLDQSTKNTINEAYNAADAAYDLASDAYDYASDAEKLAKRIANGEFRNGTFINGTEIYSPTIYADEFVVMPRNNYSNRWTGGYSMYGYFGSTLYHMLNIGYADTGFSPEIEFWSPAGAYAYWGFNRTSFHGYCDFSGATVTGITATFG